MKAMAFDLNDPLVNHIIYFFKWLKEVPMTIPKHHEQLLTRMRDHPESGTVGERILCGEVIRDAKRRFVIGLTDEQQHAVKERQDGPASVSAPSTPREYFSIAELAQRWRCSRGTVYNLFRRLHLKLTDLGPPGKRGKKAVPMATVLEVERKLGKVVR
jgi:hypothetical protein